MKLRTYNLLVNSKKFSGHDMSNDLLEHIKRLLDEVNEDKVPAIFHVDFVGSEAIYISRRNRVLSANFPLLPAESKEDGKSPSKIEIEKSIESQANEIYNYITSELALAYAEAKDYHNTKISDYVAGLDVMKDFCLDELNIKYDMVDDILNKYARKLNNNLIENIKLDIIEKFLKYYKENFDHKTLHVVCYNGNKYLFGLNTKEERQKIIDETKQQSGVERNNNQGTPVDELNNEEITKGIELIKYKDSLPDKVEELQEQPDSQPQY